MRLFRFGISNRISFFMATAMEAKRSLPSGQPTAHFLPLMQRNQSDYAQADKHLPNLHRIQLTVALWLHCVALLPAAALSSSRISFASEIETNKDMDALVKLKYSNGK